MFSFAGMLRRAFLGLKGSGFRVYFAAVQEFRVCRRDQSIFSRPVHMISALFLGFGTELNKLHWSSTCQGPFLSKGFVDVGFQRCESC